MEQNILSFLLKGAHAHYAIGSPGLDIDYPGHQKLKTILENKINALINKDQTPWSDLVNAIAPDFSENQIYDLAPRQFPSYLLEIVLSSRTIDGIELVSKLVLNVSLLCDCYTIFIEDRYLFKKYLHSKLVATYVVPRYAVVSHMDHDAYEQYADQINVLKRGVSTFFPHHRFVEHYILFNHTIQGGVPYAIPVESPNQIYPIYSYLFDGNFDYKHLDVLT